VADYQNPHASEGLRLSLIIVSNTDEEVLFKQIRENSQKYKNWLEAKPEHNGVAIIIGGGPSINDDIHKIRFRQRQGGVVFALNGSSKWCHDNGIKVDYQVIADAKEETSTLVDPEAKNHLFASQCHPKTLEQAHNLSLWHLDIGDIEDHLPRERVKAGGYPLLYGDTTIGMCSMSVVYALGFREMHLFGYDSSHRLGESHAYDQPINKSMPTTTVKWAGRTFVSSIAMKGQAERFLLFSKLFKSSGVTLHVHGDGLLQTMYNAKYTDLTEREKYQLMWQLDMYRERSPGEKLADFYLANFKPRGKVIDFGCGTGRAGIKFKKAGLDVMLVDFADNARDDEAIPIPFLVHDITEPMSIHADNGYCTDVLEHIPTDDVSKAIKNIMSSAEKVFFQISTTDDHFGEAIEEPLHLTVQPHAWWRSLFKFLGYVVEWDMEQEIASLFFITNLSTKENTNDLRNAA
jgi:hypothetical protein